MVPARETIEDRLRSHGTEAALVGGVFTIAVFGSAYLLPVPFASTISVVGGGFSLLTGTASIYLNYQTEQRERDNERFGEVAKAVEREREVCEERDEAQADLREYQRMTRILEDRDVELAKLIDNQTESSQIALLVEPDEITAVTDKYRRRWDIENEYKSIKDFMPRTSSMDYRVRFVNFVFSVLIYNLWRLTDFLIKQALDKPIRSDPVIGG